MMTGPAGCACLPLALSARMRAWWLIYQARRRPLRAAVLLAAAVLVVAGFGVLAAHGPAGGCSWRVAGSAGRAHLACVRDRRTR